MDSDETFHVAKEAIFRNKKRAVEMSSEKIMKVTNNQPKGVWLWRM
jgi:hypothetical protein